MSISNKSLTTVVALTAMMLCVIPAAWSSDFQGVIGKTASESTPWWPPSTKPPAGAPNVLIWMIDDAGFGQVANFGGLIETPSLDQLADTGLRFTNFHATALCSPTRAATLTGRNHHAVGMGAHANTPSGFPGYNARIPKSAATVARILKDRGYATYAVGKWDHLPTEHMMPNGPFDYWPSGQGFEHFYGFIAYDNHHFTPTLWRDHSPVEADLANPDYHLTTDLANQAIRWIRNQHSVQPRQPFFMYWATGAVHAPHHAPQDYIDKYKGQFDQGWQVAREHILARQKRLGVVPVSAELPPWPENVPSWESLTPSQQKMAARAMEAFAGMLDHADHEFGRIIQTLKDTGQWENTIVIAVSDNGASAEGGLAGSFNELLMGQVSWEENLKHYDQWGGPETYPHYPVGWAAAGNTPFKYYKQAAHEGGTRVPMLISWPNGIPDKGGIRNQFHHVNDIVPTLLDLIGIDAPDSVDGVKQQPMDGVSFRYAMANPSAPTQKKRQYFELWGNRGIWVDGWKAEALVRNRPWDVLAKIDMDNPVWELYHVAEDFNERHDLANEKPEKLQQLLAVFDEEATRNQVYPIGPDFVQEKIDAMGRAVKERQGRYEYLEGTARITGELAPPINMLPFSIHAELRLEDDKTEGVVFAFGGAEGGFALYLSDGKPVFAYNNAGRDVTAITSARELPAGVVRLVVTLEKDSPTSGQLAVSANGEPFASGRLEHLGARLPTHETLDIGRDSGSPVSRDYPAQPEMAQGVINNIVFQVYPSR